MTCTGNRAHTNTFLLHHIDSVLTHCKFYLCLNKRKENMIQKSVRWGDCGYYIGELYYMKQSHNALGHLPASFEMPVCKQNVKSLNPEVCASFIYPWSADKHVPASWCFPETSLIFTFTSKLNYTTGWNKGSQKRLYVLQCTSTNMQRILFMKTFLIAKQVSEIKDYSNPISDRPRQKCIDISIRQRDIERTYITCLKHCLLTF